MNFFFFKLILLKRSEEWLNARDDNFPPPRLTRKSAGAGMG